MRSLFLLFFFCFACPGLSQSPSTGSPLSRRYTQADGLPSGNVNQVLQDPKGYIWVATGAGLCRFDGYRFTTMKTRDQQQQNIYFIDLDRQGTVWAVTMNGRVFRAQGDSLVAAPFNKALEQYKNQFGIPHFFKMSSGGDTAWLSLAQLGIVALHGRENVALEQAQKRPSILVAEKAGGLLALPFVKMTENSKVGHAQFLPVEWQSKDGNHTIMAPLPPKLVPGNVCVTRYKANNYLLAYSGRIYYLSEGACLWYSEQPKRINTLNVQPDGSVLVGLHQGAGLRHYANLEALQKGVFTPYAAGETVRHCFADRDGGWWISTIDRGIIYYPNPHVWVYPGTPNSTCSALTLKNREIAYIGTSKGEVLEYNLRQGSYRLLPPLPFPTVVYGLVYEPKTGRLWAGTNYLQYWDGRSWHTFNFPNDQGIPAQHLLLSVHKNRLYAPTFKGILAVNTQNGAVEDATSPALKAFRCSAVSEDCEGRIWVATPEGIQEWKGGGAFDNSTIPSGFLQQEQYRLVATPDCALLAAAGSQMARWINGKVAILCSSDQSNAGSINDMHQDAAGRIWAATQNGLLYLEIDSEGKTIRSVKYHAPHGLPSDALYALQIAGDTLWAAGAGGLVAWPMASIRTAPLVTPVLEKVWINQRPASFSPGDALAYDENNLKLQLTTLQYATGAQTLYRYRLQPGDAWTETDTRDLFFFSLKDGTYQMEIQAQNADGQWGASLRLDWRIRPPFWKSVWFWALLSGSLLCLIVMFYRRRLRQVQRESDLLVQVANLERSALQAQMNPHFIFNCLNSIQNFILQNNRQQAAQYLADFARLVRSVLHASANGKITLDEEVKMLESYLSLEQLRFKDRFQYDITLTENTDRFEIEIPPLLIQPLVENAILHGMKNAQENGHIHIHFDASPSYLTVTVRDNGPGISEGKVSENNAGHTSMGLSITRKRLDLLQPGAEKTDSMLRIGPWLKSDQEHGGAEAVLKIKV